MFVYSMDLKNISNKPFLDSFFLECVYPLLDLCTLKNLKFVDYYNLTLTTCKPQFSGCLYWKIGLKFKIGIYSEIIA